MNSIENAAMCAHLKVEYRPKEHANGTKSDRWICLLCGGDFWPQHWLFPAPWIARESAAPLSPENEVALKALHAAAGKGPSAAPADILAELDHEVYKGPAGKVMQAARSSERDAKTRQEYVDETILARFVEIVLPDLDSGDVYIKESEQRGLEQAARYIEEHDSHALASTPAAIRALAASPAIRRAQRELTAELLKEHLDPYVSGNLPENFWRVKAANLNAALAASPAGRASEKRSEK